MVEVNGVRSEPFTLTRLIRQGCPLSPMLYILALEPFLRKLKANPVLRGLTLPGSSEVTRYTANIKINRRVRRSAAGLVEGLCSSRPLHLEGWSVQDTRRLVRA